MGLLSQYDPPGHLPDGNAIPGFAESWDEYVRALVESQLDVQTTRLGSLGVPDGHPPSFFERRLVDVGEVIDLDVTWNAFPQDLIQTFGRQLALEYADQLWPLSAFTQDLSIVPVSGQSNGLYPSNVEFRPTSEYCEWHVERNARGLVRLATFTCEPAEWWQALASPGRPIEGSPLVHLKGDPHQVLAHYRSLFGTQVTMEQLFVGTAFASPLGLLQRGDYNPYNCWNLRKGIVHLTAPPNALKGEIALAAGATLCVIDGKGRDLVCPEDIALRTGLCSQKRNSDIAILGYMNALTRQGRRLTLSNPVGVYIDHIDLSGFEWPKGIDPRACVRYLRGGTSNTTRLAVHVPTGTKIRGVPVKWGGQIAECITMRLRVAASASRDLTPLRLSEWDASQSLLTPQTVPQTAPPPVIPTEPALRLQNIQGMAVPGFLKPEMALLCVRHRHDDSTKKKVKAFLTALAPHVDDGLATLRDRRAHRLDSGRKSNWPTATAPLRKRTPLIGIAFTARGLRAVTEQAEAVGEEAFQSGMAARASLLGDPIDDDRSGEQRSQWVVGKGKLELDFMIVIAGEHPGHAKRLADWLQGKIAKFAEFVRPEQGKRLPATNAKSPGGLAEDGREHFGFVDGISQPGIRGRASDIADDFITDRHLAPEAGVEASLQGLPGQDLVWPGEFVLGYPSSGVSPLESSDAAVTSNLTMDGSFLVYRRLAQDVKMFWNGMKDAVDSLRQQRGFETLTVDSLAAHLVGRHRSGAPVSRVPGWNAVDWPAMGRDPLANNHFRFDSDAPPLPLREGRDGYPTARADPLGLVCPLASHIRKVNPRDAATDTGGTFGLGSHRILRVGIPFGPPMAHLRGDGPADGEERGLLFMCIQASIESQFEFLQSRWMNNGRNPRAPGGHDMIAGVNPGGPSAFRSCEVFGVGGHQGRVDMQVDPVTPTGGGYFFVPSLSALRDVLSRPGP